jgi:hypothetical protein
MNRFSWHYRLVMKLLDVIHWYFHIHEYIFTYEFVANDESEMREILEDSYKEKYYQTVEGKKEIKRKEKQMKKSVK